MREETEYRPKPMVEVGGRPLLWHIMKGYAAHGFNEFVCCLGYRGDVIKRYFLDYHALRSDVTVSLASGRVEYDTGEVEDWRVSLVDTGQDSMTGARVKRVEHMLGDSDVFMCTYGDGVADIDINRLVEFHRAHGRLATVTGVHPPSRFGELVTDGNMVERFSEKPAGGPRISGGFFVFSREVLERLSADPIVRARARAARRAGGRRRAVRVPARRFLAVRRHGPRRRAAPQPVGPGRRRRGGFGTTGVR